MSLPSASAPGGTPALALTATASRPATGPRGSTTCFDRLAESGPAPEQAPSPGRFGLANLSIKRKLMLIILCVSTVALLLTSGAFLTYELFACRRSMVHDLSTLGEMTGNQSTAALRFGDHDNAQEILQALRAKPNILAACLYREGNIFESYFRDDRAKALPPRHPEPEGVRFEQDNLVLFHQVSLNGEVLGTLYLKSDLQELHDRRVRFVQITLLILLLTAPVILLLSFLLQRLISQPIFELAATAQAVSSERNYALRAVRRGRDELGQLIDRFNEMLTQIQERDAALQEAHDKLERRVAERTRDLQIEIAERNRAQEGLQQQFTRLSLLNQITHVISERQDLARIQQVVLRQLEDHLAVEVGLMCLYLPETEQLEISALREKNPKQAAQLDLAIGGIIPASTLGLAQFESGKTVYASDTRLMDAPLPKRLATAGMFCAVAVPLIVEEKLLGVLCVARSAPDSFSSGECEFLRMLSEQVALAAHQAQLHSQLETAYNELRQTQQAVMQQDRLRALGQMASGIAHDINNALSPVVGFAQMLLEHEKGLSASGRKQLAYIRTAGEDVAHIVARLREFYRRREDHEPFLPLNLNRLAEQVIDMTRPRWRDIPQGKGLMIELRSELTPDLPSVLGSESELREALTNLILNGVDAMPAGGTLTVRTRLSERGYAPDHAPTHLILEVSDTGIGMNEETRRRCLEPFFSTKGRRGTGMGLAMVYGVMERHEGKIEILSELGQGTTIQLALPLPRLAPPQTASAAEPLPPPPLRILCVDDEPVLRQLLEEMLTADGHTVQLADGGQNGVDAFLSARHSRPFEVIITDLGMPFLDGRQVARIIKSESPGTPVVLLTGWGSFMKADGELPTHVDAILSKPPRVRELRETLRRLVQK